MCNMYITCNTNLAVTVSISIKTILLVDIVKFKFVFACTLMADRH